MDNTSYVALSRQVALERQMAVVAGNIANMNTDGFKNEQVLFADVLERAGEAGRVAFVQDSGLIRDPAPGPIETTGNPLDLAINGEGYFTVETANGPRYTRGGHFVLGPTGEITTSGGQPLLDEGGGTLVVPPGSGPIEVARDGTVSTADGILGRIGLVRFADERGPPARGRQPDAHRPDAGAGALAGHRPGPDRALQRPAGARDDADDGDRPRLPEHPASARDAPRDGPPGDRRRQPGLSR
ncbi:MAG: flagellar hook-basal body complex protein [Geminicoccaceae bacterium]